MERIVREYRKIDVARSMLDTAIGLYLSNGDRFSVLHLASAAEEVVAGLLKGRRSGSSPICERDRTAREKTVAAIREILKARGLVRTEQEIGSFLNAVRNGTKHHGGQDPEAITADVESEAWDSLFRAIDNYGRYANTLSEKMIEFAHHTLGTPLIAVASDGAVET